MTTAHALAALHEEDRYLQHLREHLPHIRAASFALWLEREREHRLQAEQGHRGKALGPWEAIASMREDIDALEAKNVVKPGHIRRRRNEVEAIECELHRLRELADSLEDQVARLNDELREQGLRLGMLANMLTMLGVPWEQRMATADAHEAEVMRRAARISIENNRGIPDHYATKWTMLRAMRNAIMAARIELALEQLPTLAHHGKAEEPGRAA